MAYVTRTGGLIVESDVEAQPTCGLHGFWIAGEEPRRVVARGFRVETLDDWDDVTTRTVRDPSGRGEGGCAPGVTLNGRFDLRANDVACTLEVRVRIFLQAMTVAQARAAGVDDRFLPEDEGRAPPDDDELSDLRARWEPRIRSLWTGQHGIVRRDHDGCQRLSRPDALCTGDAYEVWSVRPQWVLDRNAAQWRVRVLPGDARPNVRTWNTAMNGRTAAHEFGHMLGNVDEYEPREGDDFCPGRRITDDSSIMNSSQHGVVEPRHYRFFAKWLSLRSCCTYEVERLRVRGGGL